jgi:integrase
VNSNNCATTQTSQSLEIHLKGRGLQPTTIESKLALIRHLELRYNLYDTENIRIYIRDANCVPKRKNNIAYAYRDWCRWKGYDYDHTYLKESESKLPYIPTEKELDQLIAGFGPKYSAFLQLLKETGFRSIEARRITPYDIDTDRRVITLNAPAKNSRPRQFKLSNQLISMVIPQMRDLSETERIWGAKANTVRAIYCRKRNQLAIKLEDPKLKRITLHTFRHWKATMEYHKTKDILYVKQLLGHKSIKNTLIYTHLVDFDENDSFTVKIATSIEEYTGLLEAGFEYISDYGDHKVCRKRK